MSTTTNHPEHPNVVARQCFTPVPDPISVLRDAVAIIATLDHTSTAEATDQLVALAHTSGHHPLCVACEVAHLVDPTGHPHTHPGLGAVHQRWATPLPQRQHPPHQVPERVWAIVLAAAAPTRPTTTTIGADTGAGTGNRRSVAVSTTALQPGDQPGYVAIVDAAAPARALHLVGAPAPVCRCLTGVLPVAGHHHRCPPVPPVLRAAALRAAALQRHTRAHHPGLTPMTWCRHRECGTHHPTRVVPPKAGAGGTTPPRWSETHD